VELFRVSTDVYGRETLKGLSWDLLWVFFGTAAAIIVIHLVLSALRPSRRKA
jgi:hypothetical protein